MTEEQIDDWMFKNAEWTEQLGSAVPADKVRALLAASAPNPKPASPETLSDAELLAHFQKPPANPSDKQEAVCEHEWEAREWTPGPIVMHYAAPLAQSAEQDRIDAERWRMAILYEYVTEFEALGIDQRIAIDKGASK